MTFLTALGAKEEGTQLARTNVLLRQATDRMYRTTRKAKFLLSGGIADEKRSCGGIKAGLHRSGGCNLVHGRCGLIEI
jgi:hypothetical protein